MLKRVLFQAGLRNKSGYDPTNYSREWTNIFTSYLKKQLAPIGPPALRLGLNIKQTFKNLLADPETRAKWVNRFNFWSVNLRLGLVLYS